jgi:hypothetical protein
MNTYSHTARLAKTYFNRENVVIIVVVDYLQLSKWKKNMDILSPSFPLFSILSLGILS